MYQVRRGDMGAAPFAPPPEYAPGHTDTLATLHILSCQKTSNPFLKKKHCFFAEKVSSPFLKFLKGSAFFKFLQFFSLLLNQIIDQCFNSFHYARIWDSKIRLSSFYNMCPSLYSAPSTQYIKNTCHTLWEEYNIYLAIRILVIIIYS